MIKTITKICLHTKLCLFHQKHNTPQYEHNLKLDDIYMCQYLVCAHLLSMTAWMQISMLDTRGLQYSWVIFVTQTSSIVAQVPALGGCLYATLSFIIVHRYTIGLRSRLFPDHSNTDFLFSLGTQWLPLIGDKECHLT